MANDRDFAIVVGINDYDHFSPLEGPVNDAGHFYAWLVSPKGGDVPAGNIVKLVSGARRSEPRRDQIEDAILPHIQKAVAGGGPVGRRLYLFFAGHGMDVGDLEDCGLAMADANLIATDRSIPGRRLALAFKHSQAFEEVVLFMDCCREVELTNPAVGELAILNVLTPRPDSQSLLLHGLATKWRRRSGERELPNPEPDDGRSVQGIFTYALLDGLRRAADPAGQVTGDQLRNYVAQLMVRLGVVGQKPTIDFEPADIVLCTPGPGATSVQVGLPEGFTDFDVRDGGDRYVLVNAPRRECAAQTWSLSLRPSLYYVGAPAGREIGQYDVFTEASVVGSEFRIDL